MRNFNMTKIFVVTLVFFSTFIFTSCGGEEPNLDDESKTDTEVTDESVDDENPDESIDENIDNEESDEISDEEIVYEEITSEEECLASDCRELCFLRWQENEEIQWCVIDHEDDDKIFCDENRKYIFFQTDTQKKCFIDANGDPTGKIEATEMPIKKSWQEIGWVNHYSLTKKENVLNITILINCFNEEKERNACEEGNEIVGQINGEDVFEWRNLDFAPVSIE